MNLRYFYCYDRKLKSYLIANEHIKPITYALHPKSKLEFWQFLITDELQNGIAAFKLINNKNCDKMKYETP